MPVHDSEDALVACRHVQPAEVEPALLWHISFRDRHEARNARLGCQQVVRRPLDFAGYGVAADRQDLAPRVVQRREVHIRDERVGDMRDLGEARRHRRRHAALAPRARVPQTRDELAGPRARVVAGAARIAPHQCLQLGQRLTPLWPGLEDALAERPGCRIGVAAQQQRQIGDAIPERVVRRRLTRKRQRRLFQRPERRGEIPAVDRRHESRLEGLQRRAVVPVE